MTLKKIAIILLCLQCIHAHSFIKKNIGKLQLTQQEWKFQEILNISQYENNAHLLKECKDTLELFCKQSQNPSCEYFLRMTKDINLNIKTDIEKLNTHLRVKRDPFTIGLILFTLGVTVITAIAQYFIYQSALNDVKNEFKEQLNLLERSNKASLNMAEIIQLMSKDTNKALNILRDHYNNETKTFNEDSLFQYVMDTVILTLLNHEQFQTKLNHIYAGDLDKRLFEFVDFMNFTGEIAAVNKQLKPNLSIPEIKSMGKNNFIKISTEFNKTHLIFTLHLPVLNKNGYELNEFIPIPIREENSVFILNEIPTTFYFNKSSINILPKTDGKNLCVTQDNLMVCNTIIEESIYSPSGCLRNLLLSESYEDCLYKPIEFKNYFIRLSEETVYAFVVKPTQIFKQCNSYERVLHLTENREISLKGDCTLFKYYEDEHFKPQKTTKSHIYNSDEQLNVDFNEIMSHKPMPRIPILDKYDIEQLEIINSLRKIHAAIPVARERIDKIELKNPMNEIFGEWSLKATLIWAIIWIIGIIFFLITCFLLCKRITSK